MDEKPLHPDVVCVAPLLGTWRGRGRGDYPSVRPFEYDEELRFWHVGKPFLAVAQKSVRSDDGSNAPLHAEMGFFRMRPGGEVELVFAHPNGVAEIGEGAVRGSRIEIASTHLGLTKSAKDVRRLERSYEIRGDVLWYEIKMEAMGHPLGFHLTAELRRA